MSVLLQVVGLVALVAGFALIYPPAALVFGGFAVLLLGAIMERDKP